MVRAPRHDGQVIAALSFRFQRLPGLHPLPVGIKLHQHLCFGPRRDTNGNSPSPHADMIQSIMQQKTIKGTVVDETGEPIIGANVVEKGTTNGVITDFNGEFTLNVPLNCTVQISYIGYNTQEVKITSTTQTLNIKMVEDSETLDEVVVVGYGVQKKANLTGAVASVDFEEQAKSRPVTTVSAALAGLSAGVQVMQNSGQPGSDGATSA